MERGATDPWSDHLTASAPLTATPMGVYLHVPFCTRRCGYCAFHTSTSAEAGGAAVRRYLEGISSELRRLGGALAERIPALSSIYLGGGTPSLLGTPALTSLIATVGDHLPVAAGAEITLEAVPEALTDDDLARLAGAGVTRVSIGVQSAVDHVLRTLDREHDPTAVPALVTGLRAAGIAHVNLDLIYGTPGETPADWQRSLELVVGAGADHVSCYGLSIEPSTKLAARVRAGTLDPPGADVAAARYEQAEAVLSAAGFEWYELSNWARTPNARCTHNLLYWHNHDWLGVGPAAHSHLSGLRWWNHSDLRTWSGDLARHRLPWAGHELVDAAGRELERLMLGLRLREGVPVEGLDPDAVAEVSAATWAEQLGPRLVLTLEGRLLADEVLRRLWAR